MTNFAQLDISTSGKNYLDRILADEGGLCELMRRPISCLGAFFAVVPSGTPLTRAQQFDSGGLVSARAGEDELIKRLVKRTGVFVVQDSWAPPEHYQKIRFPANVCVRDAKNYLWTELTAESPAAIRACWGEPIVFQYAGFLIDDTNAAQQLRTGSASIEDMASHVTEIYAPAYDQESFVMWVR